MSKKVKTKDRLVHAASEIFADKGFRDATLADISEAAEANIAAVNYHFGDKAHLYYAVWAYLFAEEANHKPIPDDFSEMGAEAWLRLFIRNRIENIFDTGICGRLPRLLHREMGEPTEMHADLFEKHLKPNHDRVHKAVRSLIGPKATDDQINLAVLSFMGLHIFLNVGHQKNQGPDGPRAPAPQLPPFSPDLVLQAETFAISGLLAVRDLIQAQER